MNKEIDDFLFKIKHNQRNELLFFKDLDLSEQQLFDVDFSMCSFENCQFGEIRNAYCFSSEFHNCKFTETILFSFLFLSTIDGCEFCKKISTVTIKNSKIESSNISNLFLEKIKVRETEFKDNFYDNVAFNQIKVFGTSSAFISLNNCCFDSDSFLLCTALQAEIDKTNLLFINHSYIFPTIEEEINETIIHSDNLI